MFNLGICMGNIPPEVLYPPKTFVSGKSQLLVQQKALSFWGTLPQTLWIGVLPLDPAWGTASSTLIRDVNPLVSTVSWQPQFLAVWCQNIMCKRAKSFSFCETSSWDSLPELCPWTTLGTSEVPIPSSATCIKWKWVPLLQSTVWMSVYR